MGQGLIIGCLVAWNKVQKKRIVLYSVSGNTRRIKNIRANLHNSIFVDSIVSILQIDKALKQNDLEIHQLTDIINSLEKSKGKHELIMARRKLTNQSLENVFKLYDFTRFDEKKLLKSDYSKTQCQNASNKDLTPTGTGNCCAPKLLNYAFSHQLQIVSMDEIYFSPQYRSS